jgi:hypothetical protein
MYGRFMTQIAVHLVGGPDAGLATRAGVRGTGKPRCRRPVTQGLSDIAGKLAAVVSA